MTLVTSKNDPFGRKINMKNDVTKSISRLALCLFMLAAGSSQAAIVNFTLTGTVSTVESGNPFGLSLNDSIYASGTYDDSSISQGYIDFTTSSNNFEITVGNTVFTESMSTLSYYGLFFLANGDFEGLNYRSENANQSSFSSDGFLNFNGGTSGLASADHGTIIHPTYIEGTWDAASYTTSPVPVPAALWLFGSGLIFLGGMAKRRKS
jgi:hypothetical protein